MKKTALAAGLMLLIVSPVSASRDIEGVRVLSPSSGYVWSKHQVLRSGDQGRHWSDITPPLADDARIDFIEFPDENTGRAVIAAPKGDSISLSVAVTRDGGSSWHIDTIQLRESDAQAYSGRASVSFADAQHGWALLRLSSGSSVSIGTLYRTGDGGRTWTRLAPPPAAGRISFTSPANGWLAGGAGGDELYATRDGGNSWNRVTLPWPEAINSASWPTVDLPRFDSIRGGLLTVTYAAPSGENAVASLRTGDGGMSWRVLDTQRTSARVGPGVRLPAAVIGTRFLLVETDGAKLRIRRSDRTVSIAETTEAPLSRIVDASAVSTDDVWALVSGRGCPTGGQCLMMTSDGGGTWEDRTPYVADAGDSLRSVTASVVFVPGAKGFDTCQAPSISNLQTWWNDPNRPYKFVNMYFGGADRGCKSWNQTMITASWMQSASNIGWALLPTWVGPQAPNTWPVGKYDLISTNTTTADQQGRSEASQAASAAAAVGVGAGNILYVDIEGQFALDATTRNAVAAYVNGWVAQLHSAGYQAGVYGSAYNIGNEATMTSDWAAIANPPDAVWIVKVFTSGSCTSVFGLYPLPDTYWPNHQRLRQCTQGADVNVNGVTLNIDVDLADGPLSQTGSTSTTNPSVSLTTRQVTPTSVTVNQSFSINTTITVAAATAEHAGISISFPSLTTPGKNGTSYSSTQGTVTTSSVTPGALQSYLDGAIDAMGCRNNTCINKNHLLAEADWSNVGSGSTRTFNLTVTPKQTGTFTVRIRGWVTTNGYANAWRDPSSGNVDQQNFWVYEHTVNVTAATPSCSYTINPPSASGASSGGVGNVVVTASPAGCTGSWSATALSTGGWLSLTGTVNGSGSSTVQVPYSYGGNGTTSSRSGTIAFSGSFAGGNTFTLTQSAPAQTPCTYSVTPAIATGAVSGGNGSVQVTASPTGCSGSWSATASSTGGWLSLSGTAGGSGSSTVQVPYSYGSNSAAGSRSGTISFSGSFPAGNLFTLTQNGTGVTNCSYSFAALSATGAGAGGTGSVSVTASPAGCSGSWTANASSSGGWLSLIGTTTGSGAGTVQVPYSYAANPSTSATRVGNIFFSGTIGATFTLTQDPNAESTSGELIVNGGFESTVSTGNSTPAWEILPAFGHTLIQKGGPYPYSGTAYASLGMGDSATDIIRQTVTIPAGASAADLTFRVNATTQEIAGNGVYDTLYVDLYTPDDVWITGLTRITNEDVSQYGNTPGQYFKIGAFNLSAYRGMTLKIAFQVTNDAIWPTVFNIDDVSLQVSSAARRARADFNGDGTSDMLFRNQPGLVVEWLIANGAVQSGPLIGTRNAAYAVAGIGDFDADSKADILWRNTTTGETSIWFMNGSTVRSTSSVHPGGNLTWQIQGVGDFNSDGKADILWRDMSNGQTLLWTMNGSSIASSLNIHPGANLGYSVQGAADFNGDGITDILWRNISNGATLVWLMNGGTITSSQNIHSGGNLDWSIVGLGDLDGDSRADLLWRNTSTGQTLTWLMSGATILSSLNIHPGANLAYTLIGEGDFNGDGKADILWRDNSSGLIYEWLMNGGTIVASKPLSSDSTFSVLAPIR